MDTLKSIVNNAVVRIVSSGLPRSNEFEIFCANFLSTLQGTETTNAADYVPSQIQKLSKHAEQAFGDDSSALVSIIDEEFASVFPSASYESPAAPQLPHEGSIKGNENSASFLSSSISRVDGEMDEETDRPTNANNVDLAEHRLPKDAESTDATDDAQRMEVDESQPPQSDSYVSSEAPMEPKDTLANVDKVIHDQLDQNLHKERRTVADAEEETGKLYYRIIRNDGTRRVLVWLTQARNIFATQLPKMPREYITRLVFDRKHRSLLIIKGDKVVGGICYRPFLPQKFAEIAFCAVISSEHGKGYGKRVMNHLKEALKRDGITDMLTYADNFAIGYFRRQGFTKTISMSHDRWVGYIKDYDGGTLMQCTIYEKVDYLGVPSTITAQKIAILEAIRKIRGDSMGKVYAGLKFPEGSTPNPPGSYNFVHPVTTIPGIVEAGYDLDALQLRIAQLVEKSTSSRARLQSALLKLVDMLLEAEETRFFREPVDTSIVVDYHTKVQHPMDLGTVRRKVEQGQYHSLDAWKQDIQLITDNCRRYNPPDSFYCASAKKMDQRVVVQLPETQAWADAVSASEAISAATAA